MEDLSDDDLILMYRQGDAEAFDTLFDRYGTSVHNFARTMLGESGGAEEVLQETFLSVARTAVRYTPRGRFRAWLMRIVRNRCLNRIDSQRRRRAILAERSSGAVEPISDEPTPAGQAEAGEQGAIIRAAIADLPDRQREALALYAFEQMSYRFDARVLAAVTAGEEDGVLDIRAGEIADALAADDLGVLETPGAQAGLDAQSAQTVEHVSRLIRAAIESRASDVHFEGCEGGGGRVRFRVDGVLREHERIRAEQYAKVVSRLKIMAAMDVAETRLPQDGRILWQIEGEKYDLRVSTLPAMWGERIVCRVLARQNIPLGLENVGLSQEDLAKVRRFCELPTGILVVNGPTGCGKTTLLYSMLLAMNREANCVITIEDPVEVTFEGLSQIQIRPSVGLTFARCIRSAMRQDPDVLLVGELRDLEMMNLCAQVALTGHLVLTTLHAQTCAGAIRRLIDCGLEPFLINSTLQGVVSPRLVRMLCPKCRRPAEPARHSLSPEAARIVAGLAAPTFYEPVGCEHCSGTGYRGRTSIYEILAMDERIRQTVTAPADMAAICNAARASGMKTMLADGLEKAARGVTSIREVVRVVPPESGA